MCGQLLQGQSSLKFDIDGQQLVSATSASVVLSPSVVTRIDLAGYHLTACVRDKFDRFGAFGQRDDMA